MLRWIENFLMAILAIATLAIVSYEVIVRYFFPRYLTDWGMELTIYFTVWSIFIAGASLVRESRHVRADILLIMLPVGMQRVLEILSLTIGLVFACVLTWFGFQMVGNAAGLGELSESSLRFPLWLYYLCLPVGAALMIPPYVYNLYRYLFHFDPETMRITHEQIARDK